MGKVRLILIALCLLLLAGMFVVNEGDSLVVALFPTPTPQATATAVFTPTPPLPTSTPAPYFIDRGMLPAGAPLSVPPTTLNGFPLEGIVSIPQGGVARLRLIYELGLALGNSPRAFSKIGDCNSEAPFFLAKFDDQDGYRLGNFAYLQPVIDQFSGSFARQSMAAWRGNHSWSVIDSTWADKTICEPNESVVACEFRLHKPSIVLIRLGTNDIGTPNTFERSMRRLIDLSIESGVIPVLGTKADRLEGDDSYNEIIRRLSAEYRLPLWDFGRVAETLPNRGLANDGFHMTYVAPDYTQPDAFAKGHAVQNLTALMALDEVWRAVR